MTPNRVDFSFLSSTQYVVPEHDAWQTGRAGRHAAAGGRLLPDVRRVQRRLAGLVRASPSCCYLQPLLMMTKQHML